MITIGIDPGARYTAVSVRDNDEVLLSSTYVRPVDMEPVTWAVTVALRIEEDVISQYPDAPIGIEGISNPQSHIQGKMSMNSPVHLIRLGIVVGALAMRFPEAVVVRPGKNGKKDWYPDELSGRRPKELAGSNNGAGTRNHERSAFDVAGEVESRLRDGYKLDTQEELSL